MQLPSIIIVDDHQIFRRSLKSLIVNEQIGNVIGEASNGKEFLEIIEHNIPDLVLMDIDMPIMNGIEATKIAIEKHPNIRVLVLSMFGDENYYNQMVDAGVKGFLLKTSDIKELENAIYMVHEGKSYFSSELLQSIISNFNTKNKKNINDPETAKLTEREMDVLKLICKGLTNEKIAEQLHISPKTVKGHRANLLDKTGCNNSTSMVIYSIKHKIIEI
jgi:DNA-binding NarL/FixJ family response regulator